jgi:hypothetical protein
MSNNDTCSPNTVPGEYPIEEKSHQLGRDARLIRWRLQREAQALLPEERVAFCMRRIQAAMVDVLYSPHRQLAHYHGLMRCGSVWVCPICAAKISEHRRSELEQAIASCIANGGTVYLATYTIAHKRYDQLSELLNRFLAARKRAKQGSAVQELKKKFGVLGTVSVREVTWSEQNGWHPHCHELIFFSREIDTQAYAQVVRERWQRSAEHEGLSMNDHGFQLDRTFGAVADYVAKFGREPLREPWGTAAELAKSHLKRGRGHEHLTPFAMLELISLGHDELKPIFIEYAKWFKGKHQLVWSAGLRSRLLTTAGDLSDLDIMQEQELEEVILLGQLNRCQWSTVLRNEARGELLEVAKSGNWQDVLAFLQSIDTSNTLSPLSLGKLTNKVSESLIEGSKAIDNFTQHIKQRAKKSTNGLDNQQSLNNSVHRISSFLKWVAIIDQIMEWDSQVLHGETNEMQRGFTGVAWRN